MPIHGRILIVDDDDGIRKILSMILRQAGHVVDTAANGEEGISKSNVNFYNLAILDVRLPDIEGTKLLTLLKETTPRMWPKGTLSIFATYFMVSSEIYPNCSCAIHRTGSVNACNVGYRLRSSSTFLRFSSVNIDGD